MKRLGFKRLLLVSVGLSALSAASALAADIITKPGLPPPRAPVYVPFFSWSGFYLGINAGYGFGTSRWTNPLTGLTTGDFDVNGAMVGGTLGYNVQFGSAIFGLEADFDWSDIKGTTTVNCPLGCETKNTWLGTARGRIGYAFDRFLPYFTGGAAFGELRAASPGINGMTETKVGWTLGGGVEYAFLSNWSAKVEYLYVDLGTIQCTVANCLVATDIAFTTNIVRGGLNYKF
jgi:outer membrane immunogenic protein